MTTKEEIRTWLQEGLVQEPQPTHMLVACDTFDYEDYPLYCKTLEETQDKIKSPGEMKKIMDLYSYKLPLQKQLLEKRAWNL